MVARLQLFPSTANEPPSAAMAKVLSNDYLDYWDSNMVGLPLMRNMSPNAIRAAVNSQKAFKDFVMPGDLPPVPVGKEEELEIPRKYTRQTYPPIPIAVYTPPGTPPSGGWPVVYDIHGGGWTFGTHTSQQSILTRMCVEARVAVVSPDYRLAPDWSYPSAIEDCWEVLLWIYEQGRNRLGVNVSRFAISGISAGGHLAATMINMLISEENAPKDLKFALCLLTVPVCDNTAADPAQATKSSTWDQYKSWTDYADSPALSAATMLWFRNLFLPNPEHRNAWHASPNLVPDHFWKNHPPTRVAICEIDVLRDEGLYYAEKLKASGVPVDVEIYKASPHTTILLPEAMESGRRMIRDNVEALKKALWPHGF